MEPCIKERFEPGPKKSVVTSGATPSEKVTDPAYRTISPRLLEPSSGRSLD